MHTQSDTDLRAMFQNLQAQRPDMINDDDHWRDLWEVFQEEARARYCAEDDGDGDEYMKAVAELFDEEKAEAICPASIED